MKLKSLKGSLLRAVQHRVIYSLMIGGTSLAAHGQLVSDQMPLKVVEACEWNEVQRNNGTTGWISGDGQMTIPLDGCDSIGHAQKVKTFWINSDSRFCTELDPFSLKVTDGRAFVNHTAAVMNKVNPDLAPGFKDIDYAWGDRNDKSRSNIFQVGNDHCWTLDGWADGDSVYVYLLDKMKEGNGLGDINLPHVRIPIIKDQDGKPIDVDYQNYKAEVATPWLIQEQDIKTTMSSCIHDNTVEGGCTLNPDGYIYNFGVRRRKMERYVVAMRVLREHYTNWDKYEYYDAINKTWTTDRNVIFNGNGNIVKNVGGIFSITPITTGIYKGKYMLVSIRKQDNPVIAYRIGESLVGPFSDEYVAYGALKEMDAYGNRDVNFYNGKAHPHISNPGELLISYSANRKEEKQWLTTDKNRIRFIKLILDELAEEAPLFIVSLGAGNKTSASGYTGKDFKPSQAFGKSCEDPRKWVDDTPGDKWIRVNLQRSFYVERWQVVHDEEIFPKGTGDPLKNTRDFRLEVSDDGINWTIVDEVYGNTQGFTERDIPETKGQYWRLYITNPSQDGTDVANIVNVNLIGRVLPTGKKVATTNLCRGNEVTVSESLNNKSITDGDYDTKWTTHAGDGQQWFYVDLGEEKEIYRWRLRTAGINNERNAKNIFDFDVMVSNDAQNWHKVNEVRYNIRRTIRGDVGIKARYIKVKIITPTLGADPDVSINEFEVFSGMGAQMKSIEEATGIEKNEADANGIILTQNRPNPFKNETEISYRIVDPGKVTVKVYDVLGNEIQTLVDNYQTPGEYHVEFKSYGLQAGTYLFSIKTPQGVITKRMIKK